MSQYPPPTPSPLPPSPYQPPQQQLPTNFDYYQPAADVLGPSRRAGVMMFIVAGFMLIGAFCCGGVGAMTPQLMAQNPAAFEGIQQQMPGLTTDALRVLFIVLAVIVGALGIGMGVLGVFVRRGSKPAVVTSMVLVSLMLLYMVFNAVVSLFVGRQAPAEIASAFCLMAIPTALLALLVWLLYQALPSTDRANAIREQYMQQYWQYAYQQQMYAMQQQQGAALQPPTPPSASSPPPQPQQFWRPNPPPASPPAPGDSDAPPPPG